MPTEKGLDFFSPKTKVRVMRQRREDLADLDKHDAVFEGHLSDGFRYIATPVIDRKFGLCGTDPKQCGFMTTSPVIAIMLYEQGWIVLTHNEESYMITVERGMPQ